MNELNRFFSSSSAARDAAHGRFARQVVGLLSEEADRLPTDIGERLRFARESAIARARSLRASDGSRFGLTAGGAVLLGGGSGWGLRLAALLPLVALACGLVLIGQGQTRAQISMAAEVDAALLADDLPPNAYRDAGFVEFLKTPPRQ